MRPFFRFVSLSGAATIFCLCVSAAIGLVLASASSLQIDQDAVSKSTLIFSGEITRLGSATMPIVPVSANTIVVRVEKIISAANPGMDYAGREITVLVKNPLSFKVGDSFVFYTKGWLAGESVAVQELGSRRVALTGASNSLLKSIDKSTQIAENAIVQRRIEKADLIIEGKVVSTEPAEVVPVGETTAEEGPKAPLIIEHDPQLKRALIEVVSVVSAKGTGAPKTVTVLFPSSQDIKWADMPRFERGDSGLFILSKADQSEEFKKILSLLKGRIEGMEKDYFISDTSNYQPRNELERIKSVVKTLSGNNQ